MPTEFASHGRLGKHWQLRRFPRFRRAETAARAERHARPRSACDEAAVDRCKAHLSHPFAKSLKAELQERGGQFCKLIRPIIVTCNLFDGPNMTAPSRVLYLIEAGFWRQVQFTPDPSFVFPDARKKLLNAPAIYPFTYRRSRLLVLNHKENPSDPPNLMVFHQSGRSWPLSTSLQAARMCSPICAT